MARALRHEFMLEMVSGNVRGEQGKVVSGGREGRGEGPLTTGCGEGIYK